MSQPSRARRSVLTLTTDFGVRDHYVGAMKGVVARIAPRVNVVDITHELPPFSIPEGAFAIWQAQRWFPPSSVHVVVVDPGVGSARRPVAVRAGGQVFVAPDNGVLSYVVESSPRCEAREIRARHGLAKMSRTFHGRDLFAPVGARLAAGLRFAEVGPLAGRLVGLPSARPSGGRGRVLHVDRFGNVVTNFKSRHLRAAEGLRLGAATVTGRADSYADAPPGELVLIEGSSGFLEVSADRESAAGRLGVEAGSAVVIAPSAPSR